MDSRLKGGENILLNVLRWEYKVEVDNNTSVVYTGVHRKANEAKRYSVATSMLRDCYVLFDNLILELTRREFGCRILRWGYCFDVFKTTVEQQ